MLSTSDRRWTASRIGKLKHIFRKINKNAEIIKSDSREQANNVSRWLPGGIITIILRRVAEIINKSFIIQDKKER